MKLLTGVRWDGLTWVVVQMEVEKPSKPVENATPNYPPGVCTFLTTMEKQTTLELLLAMVIVANMDNEDLDDSVVVNERNLCKLGIC
ncbi:unnamed protein product [Bubo scandiacus]